MLISLFGITYIFVELFDLKQARQVHVPSLLTREMNSDVDFPMQFLCVRFSHENLSQNVALAIITHFLGHIVHGNLSRLAPRFVSRPLSQIPMSHCVYRSLVIAYFIRVN